jgi:hypothetical protein
MGEYTGIEIFFMVAAAAAVWFLWQISTAVSGIEATVDQLHDEYFLEFSEDIERALINIDKIKDYAKEQYSIALEEQEASETRRKNEEFDRTIR